VVVDHLICRTDRDRDAGSSRTMLGPRRDTAKKSG